MVVVVLPELPPEEEPPPEPPPFPPQLSLGAELIAMLKAAVLEPALFVAATVKLNVPLVVGVPEMTPLVERVKPPGRVPPYTAHVTVVALVAVRV